MNACVYCDPGGETVERKAILGTLCGLLRADFLRLRHFPDTACLIADVHMLGMTGVELHRHLVDAGYAIPRDGVICCLSKPMDDDHLERCLRSALQPSSPIEENS